jgi:membrane associated rhomboid family serine protease
MKTEKSEFIRALIIPILFCIIFILFFLSEKILEINLQAFGLYPRNIKGIPGIVLHIFVHGSIQHLLNNLLSFFVLSVSLYYFYKKIASKILLLTWLITGCLLWSIGRDSWHIGASGLIYGLAFFLFFSGIFRKHIPLIAISFVVAFLYGNMVWHIFPWQQYDPVSWEGHLSGGIAGLVLALMYKKEGPQRPVKEWKEEENEEEKEFAEYAESFEIEGEEKNRE